VVIISQYEANKLRPGIQDFGYVVLYQYAARQNKVYQAVDAFQLYKVPSDAPREPIGLPIELHLFAGQSYFSSFEEYTDVCNYLSLLWTAAPDGVQAGTDGFIEPKQRKGQKTHVGKMLNGMLLTEDDFEPRPKRKSDEIS
jgi:hypothetical protein